MSKALRAALHSCPVRTVESQAFKEAIRIHPQIYRTWAPQDRWRLLYGLDTSLLDYSGILDLSAIHLDLPSGLGGISYRRIAQALQEVDFELDKLDWSEELPGVQSMAPTEPGSCHAALCSDQANTTVCELIDCGIAFINSSDDYPVLDKPVEQKTLAQALMGLIARLGLLPKARKTVQLGHQNGGSNP